nr:ribonuclease H-like domain-containing protein [Tanacetum cinerariifolium]
MLKASSIYLPSKLQRLRAGYGIVGKSKKSSHQPKAKDTNQEKLYLLHMDLCGLMRMDGINKKKYILVIVDDYSRVTWVKFLRSKDEAPDAIIKCIKNIQVCLNATVRNVRTELKQRNMKITDSDNQYAVSIKKDTAYLCLHFTKDYEGNKINTSYLENPIRRIQVIECKNSRRYQMDKEVVVGEGVVVTSSSLEMLTNSCLEGIMVSLIFLEGLEEEALVEFMVEVFEEDEDDKKNEKDGLFNLKARGSKQKSMRIKETNSKICLQNAGSLAGSNKE